MGYLPVDGGRLYYETAGLGRPLVMIHAAFLDSRMWDGQFKAFARKYKVIRYDVRGFGRSSRPTETYSDAEDLLKLVEHLKIRDACLLGVSNGGRIALDFVTALPSSVKGLILVSPGIAGYISSGPKEDELWADFGKLENRQNIAIKENRIRDAVGVDLEMWATEQSPNARRRLFQIALANSHVHKNMWWWRSTYRQQESPQPPAFERLGSIHVPTLLIVGDRDVKGMQLRTERLHRLIPGSELRVIGGADHVPNTSRPREFNALVSAFLKNLDS
jgi:pimeloyl-ACP methyl ester carboxylesterase